MEELTTMGKFTCSTSCVSPSSHPLHTDLHTISSMGDGQLFPSGKNIYAQWCIPLLWDKILTSLKNLLHQFTLILFEKVSFPELIVPQNTKCHFIIVSLVPVFPSYLNDGGGGGPWWWWCVDVWLLGLRIGKWLNK